MRKLLLSLGMAGAMAALSAYGAYDGTVTLNSGPYQNGSGGEFTAVTTGLGTFQTFCIETVEHIAFGSGYNYWMNSGAVVGNGGAAAVDPHTGLPMDNISIGTAWLYSQFSAGTLANYFNANRNANAGALQQAIWWLEGEAGGARNAFIDQAEIGVYGDNAGRDLQIILDAGAQNYGVIALNLYDGAYSERVQAPDGTWYNLNQDVLAIVPEPTTMLAGALLLLPFGMSTLRILRRTRTA